MNAFNLFAKLSLDSSGFESGLNGAKGLASKFGSGVKKAFTVGAAAIGAATAAVGAFAAASVNTGMEFDKSMSQVAATMGTTVDQIQELRDFALEMGSSTAFSATQAADALNYMALAGYDAETSMNMLPNVLNLAAAGGMDLATASDMITDASSALGLSLKQTSKMVDQMAKASSKSNTSVSQLGAAILAVGGTAKAIKGGTTELSTILGVLADNGIKGAEGGTALRNVLLGLQNEKFEKSFGELGVKVYDAAGNMREMKDILADMNAVMSDMTDQQKTSLINDTFNRQDLAAVNALLATSAERWDELTAAIEEADGAAEDMANTQLDNLAGDVTLFKSALEGAKITISDQLTPTLREFVQLGTGGIEAITKGFQEGGLQGAMEAFGNWLSEALNKVIEKTPEITNVGITLLTSLLDGMVENIDTVGDAITKVIIAIGEFIISAAPKLATSAVKIIAALANGLKENLPELLPTINEAISTIVEVLTDPDAINTMLDAALTLILALGEGLADHAGELVTAAFNLILSLATYLTEHLDEILDTAVEIVMALANALIEAVPELIPAVIEIINKIVTELTSPERIGDLIDVAIDLIIALAEGLVEAIPKLVEKAPEIITNLLVALVENLPKLILLGPKLILAIVKGIIDNIQTLVDEAPHVISEFAAGIVEKATYLKEKAKELIDNFVEGIKQWWEDIKSTGADIVNGIWEGISGKYEEFKEKITGFFSGIIGSVKEFLGIASPSKLFANIGDMMALGLEKGFDDGMTDAERSMMQSVDGMVDALSGNALSLGSVDFASSGLGKSSAALINGMATSNQASSMPSTIQVVLPDGTEVARAWLPDLINAASAAGTPILA